MFDKAQQPLLASRVRALQIIIAALVLGIFAFMAVAYLVSAQQSDAKPFDTKGIISYVALVLGGMSLFLGPMLSTVVTAAGRRKIATGGDRTGQNAAASVPAGSESSRSHDGKLLQLYMVKTMIGAVVYEGAAVFLCSAYLLEQKNLTLILAILIAAGLVVQIPSRDRAERWLQDQTRRMGETWQVRR